MKYKESMETNDKYDWEVSVEEGRKKIEKYDMWTQRKLQDLTPNEKIITYNWDIKKKSNGTYQCRVNAIRYEQVEGLHYDTEKITLPVTKHTSIRIFMVFDIYGWMDREDLGREG